MDKGTQEIRKVNLQRLSSYSIKRNRTDYIVMYYLIKELKKAIPKYAFGDVLDIGCGNKPYEALFKSVSQKYIGCDVVQSSEQKVDILCQATDIKAPNESFDTVFTTQVLEHVDNSDLMIKECNRVLKPGGVFILSAPFTWELHEEPFDFFRFTKYGLKALCDRNNLEVIEIIPNGGKWATLAQINLNIFFSALRKKNFFLRAIKFSLIHFHFTTIYNWIAVKFDSFSFDPLITLNYVLVARKK